MEVAMATLPVEKIAEKIILSLDHDFWEDALHDAKLFAKIGGKWVKVNPIHLTDKGWGIVTILKDLGLKIFADPKFFNTEKVLGKTAEVACKYGPDMMNCAATSGLNAMSNFATECLTADLTCMSIAVTLLTSIGPKECMETYCRSPAKQVQLFAEQAARSGIDGVVCSGHELKTLKSDPVTENLWTVVPGIRNLGDDSGDQMRIMTPYRALQAGADYLVIGSSLIKGDLSKNWDNTRRLYTQEQNDKFPA